jgi:hypothetical protein
LCITAIFRPGMTGWLVLGCLTQADNKNNY